MYCPFVLKFKVLHPTAAECIFFSNYVEHSLDRSYSGHKTHFKSLAAAAAKLLQSRATLCYPRDGSPPGSPIPGILQAKTLEWVALSFSNVWKWKLKGKSLSRVQLLATPWTAAYQAPPSMGFSRQEYWSGVPLPPRKALLLLLSHFSRVRLCATPETAAHQAPLSLGFSRQEHWSGLPFPSPIHESEVTQ